MRATVADIRFSSFPQVLGRCANDFPEILAALNEVTERLLLAAGETGWYGCWQRVVFTVSVANPYITLPRQFVRAINLDVCRHPIRLHNEFWEFMPNGQGLKSPPNCQDWCGTLAGYERGNVPTMVSPDQSVNNFIRVYITNSADVGKRILLTGLDSNGMQIYSLDGTNNVNGTFLTFAQPFVTTSFFIKDIQALQKDVTLGDVIVKAVSAVTGVETTLARLAPTEVNPSYRRFYIHALPSGCCAPNSTTISVTALCKLDFVPVYQDTDQLIITNKPALIEEAQALRYSRMDNPNALVLSEYHHKKAIKLLQNEQRHQMGVQEISVTCNPFEGAPLSRQMIGSLT